MLKWHPPILIHLLSTYLIMIYEDAVQELQTQNFFDQSLPVFLFSRDDTHSKGEGKLGVIFAITNNNAGQKVFSVFYGHACPGPSNTHKYACFGLFPELSLKK